MTISLDFGRQARLALLLLAGASLSACVTPRYPSHAAGPQIGPAAPGQGGYKVGAPYQVAGIWYVPREDATYDQTGIASWYGDEFHQKATANGETFDMNAASAAHTTLPLPSMVEVTNLDNGKKLVVRVNDRGPFVDNRIIDLSHEAARELGYDRAGLAHVRVRYVGPAPLLGPDAGIRYAGDKPLPTRLASVAPARAAMAYGAAPDPALALAPGAAAAPMRAAPAVVGITSGALPPLTGAAISSTPIAAAPIVAAPLAAAHAGPAALASTASVASGLRIQAGAFSSEVNAQRAAAQLATAGRASVEPVQRDGLTLYRVVLPAPADEVAAYALRDRVAEIGFADARVVRIF
ncbi:septal ring lytic transglycosylase RlpA family protein [Phenylobacterium sp.]|uniref:septal ring lytic transglycosylase RlpA family protein n=1 Tax=Phenylobacterium sp. TaxID=1871053 RepID=UPI0025E14CF8|nr:septal ring lytic transglycosylase RlpA family protein [Phenylobacterium sp.]